MRRVLQIGKGPPDHGGIAAFLTMLQQSELGTTNDLRLLNLTREEIPRTGRLSVANIRRTLSDAVRVWRAVGGVDVVHVHTALAPTVTAIRAGLFASLGRARGARVIVHAHSGKVEPWLRTPQGRWLARIALFAAHVIVAVSETGERALRAALGPRRIALIRNGVDLDVFRPIGRPASPRRPPRILYCGVLTPRKGVVDLLEASRILSSEGVDHELWLVGGTPDEGPEAEAAVRAKATDHVRFCGPRTREQMPEVYAGSDVFCLPSWWEALPLSVLEAMACGLPVVATTVGDVPTCVVDGVSGRLVPPREPKALASALGELVGDEDLRRAMGVRGRRIASEHFDANRTVEAIESLYGQLVP